MNLTTPASALGHRHHPRIESVRAIIAGIALHLPLIAPLLTLVSHRLRRTLERLDRLTLRWQRGRHHPRIRPRGPRKPSRRNPAETHLPARTPQGHAWLIRLHQPLAQLAPRIALILEDPDTAALCAAAPQAGRLLRPLARMFGLPLPAHIAPPPRPPKPPKPRKPKPPPFRWHSPAQWPFVPHRMRLRVPGLPKPGTQRPATQRAPPRSV